MLQFCELEMNEWTNYRWWLAEGTKENDSWHSTSTWNPTAKSFPVSITVLTTNRHVLTGVVTYAVLRFDCYSHYSYENSRI